MPYLHGFATHLPERVVSNQELAELVNKDPAWIEKASGIRERRWAADDETIADLAVTAGRKCLELDDAGEAGPPGQTISKKIGMLLLASGSAATGFPGPAAEVAERLGLDNVPALDVPIASAGSLFALVLAARCAEQFGDVLVIGAEKMSAVLKAAEPNPDTMILFGDGAGAAVVSAEKSKWRIGASALHSDGQFRADLAFDARNPSQGLVMNGLSVIMQASRKLPAVIQEVLTAENIAPADVGAFVLHQANQNLLTRVAKALGVPSEKFFSNIARYGNTSSASLMIALAEWVAENPELKGSVVLAAFGAGFHWGAVALRHNNFEK